MSSTPSKSKSGKHKKHHGGGGSSGAAAPSTTHDDGIKEEPAAAPSDLGTAGGGGDQEAVATGETGDGDSTTSGKRKRNHRDGSSEDRKGKKAAAAAGFPATTLKEEPAPMIDWQAFVNGYTATQIETPKCRDTTIPGCIVLTVKVLSTFDAKPKSNFFGGGGMQGAEGGDGGGGKKAAPKAKRMLGTGIVIRIDKCNERTGKVNAKTKEGEILEVQPHLMVEEGEERKHTYVLASSREEYGHFLKNVEPVQVFVGGALDFSCFITKDFTKHPNVGEELTLSLRHAVVGDRDFVNTPGTPMVGPQRGIFEIYRYMTRMLGNQKFPRAHPPRYDGMSEMVRFPLFISHKRCGYLTDGNVIFTDGVQMRYSPASKEQLAQGQGLNRPLEVDVRICITAPKQLLIGINQNVSIYPGTLTTAIPGVPKENVITILAQPEVAPLVDLLMWYKGKPGFVAMSMQADEVSLQKAESQKRQLAMRFAQPEATATFVILHIGRLLQSDKPRFAIQIDAKSSLVTAAIRTDLHPDLATTSLIPAVKRDLRNHHGGTAAVLCTQVAKCLATDMAAPDAFRSLPNFQFFVLPVDGKPISQKTANLLKNKSPDSEEFAETVEGCISEFYVIVYISLDKDDMVVDAGTATAPAAAAATPETDVADMEDEGPFTQVSGHDLSAEEEDEMTATTAETDIQLEDIPDGF